MKLTLAAAALCCCQIAVAQPSIRPAVAGGLRVNGNQLLDNAGRVLVLQGTEAPLELGLDYAGTMFSTIRQRWNMNMVRLPVSVGRSEREPGYIPRVAEMVRRANQAELFAILVAVEEGASLPTQRTLAFWTRWAAYFKDSPLVGFDLFAEPEAEGAARQWQVWRNGGGELNAVGMQTLAAAIRSAGARQQPIIAMVFDDAQLLEGFSERWLLDDGNVIYEVCPMNRFHATNAARDRAFGFMASRVPLMAAGWDPELDRDEAECRSVPRDAKAVAELVRSHLNYFDARGISWSASLFTGGRMVFSMNSMEPTQLYKRVECGVAENPAQGIGLTVQLHQWSMNEESLISVSAGAGAIEVARGAVAIGYARITERQEAAEAWPLPVELGGVQLRITDSLGVVRMAPLLYAGTGSINYLVAAETAPGMATVELLRGGEVGPAGCIIVADIAPGFFSATMNARGPVVGEAVQSGGERHGLFQCETVLFCRTVPVRVAADGSTLLYLYGNGFRNAAAEPLRATLGGHHVHIVEAGPQPEVPYNDRLVLQLGPELAGLAEEDLVFWAGPRVANVVRVHLR